MQQQMAAQNPAVSATGFPAGVCHLFCVGGFAAWLCNTLFVTAYHQRLSNCRHHHHQLVSGQITTVVLCFGHQQCA